MSNENLGTLIHDRRTELDLSLEDVAKAVGVAKSTVAKWEKGMIKNMGRDKIAALAHVLGMNPASFILPTAEENEEDATERLLQKVSEEERTLFRLARNAKPEAIRAAVAVLKSMQETNDDF